MTSRHHNRCFMNYFRICLSLFFFFEKLHYPLSHSLGLYIVCYNCQVPTSHKTAHTQPLTLFYFLSFFFLNVGLFFFLMNFLTQDLGHPQNSSHIFINVADFVHNLYYYYAQAALLVCEGGPGPRTTLAWKKKLYKKLF